ncbi:Crp/Fnr family transcriptional regulator [Micromonospora sp. LOL_025]|uniref:Crp/Fnr family transcriptional regulator n=1 Tax=Micromonospora sp. LOL_025 TaxID=3345413 RepID=UPI003A8514CD
MLATGHFWGQLTGPERDAFEARSDALELAHGHVLFRQGEPAGKVVLVQQGWLKVVGNSATGCEVILAFRGAGELLGELSIFGSPQRSATVQAVGRVQVRLMNAAAFTSFLHEFTRLPWVMLAVLAERLRHADRHRTGYASADVVQRLAALLVEVSVDRQDPIAASGAALPLTQTEIAAAVAASREQVVRALRVLRELGHVSTGRGQVRVHHLEPLRAVATGSRRRQASVDPKVA